MSLQLWLPLNGNAKNKGVFPVNNFSVANTTCITVSNEGKIGKCYDFNSTVNNSGIYHVDAGFMEKCINNHSFSLCIWVKTTATDTCALSLSYGLRIFVGDSSHTYVTLYNSSRTVGCGSSTAVNDGNWHHICVTYNVDTNKIAIYVDGLVKSEVSYTSGYTYSSSWTNGLFIGKDPNNVTVNDHYLFKGKLNDVRVYDHALSVAEIKELAKGLIVHYKLDEFNSSDNLLVNGFGELGTTGWTNTSAFSTTEIPPGHPEIKASMHGGNMTSVFTPIVNTHTYTISGYIKATSSSGTTYPSIFPYDIDKKFIDNYKSQAGFNSNYKTTLAQPLHTGDTVIYATDLSAWTTGDNYYYHVAIFGYKNSLGEVYPDMIYTQDSPAFGTKTDKSHIDKTNNTITLNAAFTGEDRPAGTTICQATEGSTYYYPWGGISLSSITDWTFKTANFKPSTNNRLKACAYIRWSTHSSCRIAGNKLIDTFNNDSRVTDSSGYGYHGVKNGNIGISTNTGRYSYSSSFNGVDSLIESDPLPLETKTISIWVRTSWVSVTSYKMLVHDKQTGLAMGWTSNRLITYIGTGNGGSGSQIDMSTTSYTANAWNHIVVVKTGDTTRNVYVNGVLAAPSSVNYWGGDLNKLNIGGRHINGAYGSFFDGRLSDFRAYATQLSADDVLALYNTGAKITKDGEMMSYEFKEE